MLWLLCYGGCVVQVVITGPAEAVDECRDKLLCMAEEFVSGHLFHWC